jgi:Fe-S cluster biogenesis protein NfuA
VSGKNFKVEWALKDLTATEREELDGRCSGCLSSAANMKKDL